MYLKTISKVSDLSVWAFSTENLRRVEDDKKLVYTLLKKELKDLLDSPWIYNMKIRVNVVGRDWWNYRERLGS